MKDKQGRNRRAELPVFCAVLLGPAWTTAGSEVQDGNQLNAKVNDEWNLGFRISGPLLFMQELHEHAGKVCERVKWIEPLVDCWPWARPAAKSPKPLLEPRRMGFSPCGLPTASLGQQGNRSGCALLLPGTDDVP